MSFLLLFYLNRCEFDFIEVFLIPFVLFQSGELLLEILSIIKQNVYNNVNFTFSSLFIASAHSSYLLISPMTHFKWDYCIDWSLKGNSSIAQIGCEKNLDRTVIIIIYYCHPLLWAHFWPIFLGFDIYFNKGILHSRNGLRIAKDNNFLILSEL